ncbi:hypothetical protein [Citrobacter sp. Cb004]|uniref:hypothetical protein n=1 Tax=Citrobacter sp. Cb004 TaxID=2985006 RepID=UPI0025773FFF|nr:hypothetical protein [Citrobacter sp. Cb004]MDM3359258.1 hypothetical protein [Citrobacter sp. Cb004]
MRNDGTLSQEEKFILIIDKYITRHPEQAKNNEFYRKFYMLFVGYHLKYFYARSQYSNSCFHVDNIMQMFIGVVSRLNGNLLRQLANSGPLLQSLNSLVSYISKDPDEAERIYADLLAQYERGRISRSMAYTPPRPGGRKRL